MPKSLALAAALLLSLASFGHVASAANHLVFQPNLSKPPDEQPPTTPRPRESGRKGIGVTFAVTDDFGVPVGGAFTINTAGATVQLLINGDPPLTCSPATMTPALGACGFITTSTIPGNADTVSVYYNGDLPASKTVMASVSGVVTAGLTQDPNPALLHFLSSVTNPRTPVSLEMVFDISGSMALPSVPGAPTSGACPVTGAAGGMTRLCSLQQAAGLLLDQLPGHAMLGDKLGLTFFSSTASGGALTAAHDPGNVAGVRSTVLAQVPTNATSLGAGLNLANSAGFSGDSNPRKFVLLFSDGDQNTAPLIDQDPLTCSAGSTLKVAGVPYAPGVAVCPITTGIMTACGYKLQQSIAQAACSGNYLHIQSGSSTFSQNDANIFFTQALNNALIGDKLEIVREITGTLAPETVKTETFRANKGEVSLSLLMSWANLPKGDTYNDYNPAFRLFAPDGSEVDVRAMTVKHAGSSVTTLHFPLYQKFKFIDPNGQWKIELHGLKNNAEGAPLSAADYQIIVVSDNRNLASSARATTLDPGTGDAIPIEVHLSDNNVPIAGATVIAALIGPDSGLGDSLAKAGLPQGAPVLNGDLAGSAARAKLDLLLSDPAFVNLLKDQTLPSIILTADASGVYRGQFGAASKEGHYQFAIVETGAVNASPFERLQRLSVYVRPKADPAHTELTLVSSALQADKSVLVQLKAVAHDRFGSLLGPDYGAAFQIKSSLGAAITPVIDQLDGGYGITYRLPSSSSNPVFTVVVMGDVAKTVALNELSGASHARYYYWLALVLLLILLAIIIWRRRHHHH